MAITIVFSNPVGPDYGTTDIHSWTWLHRALLRGQDQMTPAFRKSSYDLPPPEFRDYREWQWWYNLNLIGKDRLPTGKQVSDLSNPPDTRDYRSWEWSYNLNLIGKDRLPSGKYFYELTIPDIREFRSWEYKYLQTLIGADKVPGKALSDLSQIPDIRDYRSWEWKYLQTLINQDKLPNRQQDWPNPLEFRDYRDWSKRFQLTPPVVAPYPLTTFSQYDWPPILAQQYWDNFYTWKYLYQLIGKDQLPNRQQDWPVPPEFREYRDWNQRSIYFEFNPFRQSDWPVPPEFRDYRSWEYAYLKELINQDKLPNRQQDWPNPYPVVWYQDWNQNLLETPFQTIVIQPLPKNQYDWPNPYPVTWDQFWAWKYLQELIGRDVLPHSQYDWPIPPEFREYRELYRAYDTHLYPGQDKLPSRQQDWPTPYPVIWLLGDGFFNPNYYPPSSAITFILMPQICL